MVIKLVSCIFRATAGYWLHFPLDLHSTHSVTSDPDSLPWHFSAGNNFLDEPDFGACFWSFHSFFSFGVFPKTTSVFAWPNHISKIGPKRVWNGWKVSNFYNSIGALHFYHIKWPCWLIFNLIREKGRLLKKCGLLHMVLKPQTVKTVLQGVTEFWWWWLMRDVTVVQVRNPEGESCFSRRANCEEIGGEQRNLCWLSWSLSCFAWWLRLYHCL